MATPARRDARRGGGAAPSCPRRSCSRQRAPARPYGWLNTRHGRRRRYRCPACSTTFSRTTGTALYRIQHAHRRVFRVLDLRMEGVSIAAIARLEGISWNTAARWLERAAKVAAAFQDAMTWDLDLREVQADEIRTFAPGKRRQIWIYTTMEVSSRFWPVLRVGRRGHRATMRVMREVAGRGRPGASPLVATDGYRYYKPAVRSAFGRGCAFGQVIKSRRKDRVVQVERRIPLCTRRKLENAIEQSEDSSTLNTSFIERLNLTVRQGSAYLGRRTAAHARSSQHLLAHLELFRCFYNFMKPHSALRFGREVRTPAQQAGTVARRMGWADVLARRCAGILGARILRAEFGEGRLPWAA